MYSKTFQHPVFPMREFVLKWEKRYEAIQVLYQGNLILEFENLKELYNNSTIEIDGIGKLEVLFLPNPFRFEIIVNGIESPQNHNHPTQKIKRRTSLMFLPMMCYLIMTFVSYTESKSLIGTSQVFDQQMTLIGLGLFCFSLIVYVTLMARIVLGFMIYYWFHIVAGMALFLMYLWACKIHFDMNQKYDMFVFTVIWFAVYFTGVFWLLRMLYLPCKKLFKINRMIAASEELLD
ncbi:MAG: hypothetical protein QE487_19265 [Fluviicola sp.]|nr:hypothetical protein [Fluviicola sp.]